MRRSALAFTLALCCWLQACATYTAAVAARVHALLPADAILLGEQHDAPDHQRLQRALVQDLARRGQLAALAIEMAEQGHSTAGLVRDASEAQVRSALRWSDGAWPWASYGPVVMAAVRHGVPVLGANLPREAMRAAMTNLALDAQLTPSGLEQQRAAIRSGHCMLLPENRIAAMTRIQIARDAAMAGTVMGARQVDKTVLLIAGGAHVMRDIGVPAHLPAMIGIKVILAVAGQTDPVTASNTDMVWETTAVPSNDHCAELAPRIKP